jgi:transcriptional regulator GlxA family with amidase domain
MSQRKRVVVVGYPDAEMLDIACVTTALAMADVMRHGTAYQVSVASPGAAPIRCWTGLALEAQEALERVVGPIDTLIVVGGLGYRDAIEDRRLIAHVRRLSREARRVASVCTGAGILAAAGILDGRTAASHWDHVSYLSKRFPAVTFDGGPIYITDGDVTTSAGVTAGLDLTLSFIEADLGAHIARDVARQLVTYLHRPGNQAQMSMYTDAPVPHHSVVKDAIEHIAGNLAEDLSTTALAARVGVSERHLTRLFLREVEQTPGRYVRRVRIEAAAHLLVGSDLTVDAIASRCGFSAAEPLRQAFQSRYGVSPSHYRATQSRCTPVSVTPAS